MCKFNRVLGICNSAVIIVLVYAVTMQSGSIQYNQSQLDDTTETLFNIVNEHEAAFVGVGQAFKELSVRCELSKCKCNKTVPVSTEAKPKGKIYMHTMPGCPPCEKWKREELQKALDAGWEVEVIQYGARGKSYPQFEVEKNGDRFWIKPGFYTFEQLRKAEAP